MKFHRKVLMAGLQTTLVLMSAACRETPSEPSAEEFVHGGRSQIHLDGLLVSLSRGLTDTRGFAFVSLAPGSFEGDIEFMIGNGTDGSMVNVPLSDGGFDPIAVPATPGDMLSVAVVDLSGLSRVAQTRLPIPLLPPVVVRTYPTRRRTSVPLNALLLVVFSEPIDPASLTAESIRLLGNHGPVSLDLKLRDQGTAVEIRPRVAMLPSSDYALEISTGIKDLGGEHLVDGVVIEFSTEPANLGNSTFAVRLLPDTLRLPLGTYSGFVVAVDSGARLINVFPDTSLTWGTTDPSVTTVDWAGSVGAVALGEAYVTVEYRGDVDSALVIVTDSPPPGPFQVFPDGATVPVGAVLQFDVSHPLGSPRPDVTWSSTDPAVFVVDDSGTVTTLGAGVAYLVAEASAAVDSADIEVFDPSPSLADLWILSPGRAVLEVGDSLQLELLSTTGAPTPPPVQWVSQNPQVASVNVGGLLRAVAPGRTEVTAWFDDGSGVGTVVDIVEVGGLGSITLQPTEITVAVGDTVPFVFTADATAAGFFGASPEAWSWSQAGEVLRFLPYDGVFVAVNPGVAHVSAHLGPLISNRSRVTVEE